MIDECIVHASPSFELLLQRPRWFAIRSTVAGASAEPRSEMVFGAVAASGFVCGTKIGGNFAPSGVHEVSEDCEGIENGTSDLKVAESTRGFGTLELTRMPCQFIGRRMLPAGSIVNRDSDTIGLHGGAWSKHVAWKSFGRGSAMKCGNTGCAFGWQDPSEA